MIRIVHCIAATLLCLIAGTGCASRQAASSSDQVTIFVPGVFGNGPWYDGMIDELRRAAGPVDVFSWGAPKALFPMNFSDAGIHDDAEKKLAATLDALPANVVRIHLVGHSAGCGVVLGAIPRSKRTVQKVLVIAPSVSPTYDIAPAAARAGSVDVFYSDRDTTYLKWRTSNFGTYDRIKTPAAGYAGFTSVPPNVRQHPYDPAWEQLGNDGGHGGGTARAFVREIVSPLLRQGDQPR